ncbi:ABC transporter substrate-binding protein [Kribbella sp. NPDC048928]|uniref:ABC transporter substrate-binding protein n=1 Tax=Kribbella sp. NPDC048928 TaxID=3364111 RepID=UPI00370FB8E5
MHRSGSPFRVLPRLAAGLAVGTLVLAGCSSGHGAEGGSSASNELTVWFPGNNQAEIDLVKGPIAKRFQDETGAKLNITFVDWGDISTKLNTAFAAGTAPDLFGHGPAAAADFVANDRLESLDKYVDTLDAADKKDLAAALPGGQVDGHQYLVPLSMQGSLLIYDADDFKKAGLDPGAPPKTWEEVKAAAEKLTVRKDGRITRAGLLLPSQAIGRQQTFASLLASDGGQQLDDSGKPAVDSDAGVKALGFFRSLYDGAGAVSTNLGADYVNAPPQQQPIVTDQAAMELQSSAGAVQIAKADPKLDLRVMDAVPFAGQAKGQVVGGAGPGLMMNADSKHKDLAWKFISYMVSPETSNQYAQGVGQIPTRASASSSAYVKQSPILQAFVRNAGSFFPNPNVPGWVQARDQLDKQLEQSLKGGTDPAKALGDASKAMQSVLAR